MCRNIKTLYNVEPPVTDDEVRAAALQYVRKISGYAEPSAANQEAFAQAVDEVARASSALIGALVTAAQPQGPRGRGRQGPRPRRPPLRLVESAGGACGQTKTRFTSTT